MIGLRTALVLGMVAGLGGMATQCAPRRPPVVAAPAPVKVTHALSATPIRIVPLNTA